MAVTINGTSGISGPDGSAGTPALQGSDTNTGVFFGTDEIKLSTGGTQRAVVDSSGRVGIGTASPGQRLHVNTDSSDNVILASAGSGYASYHAVNGGGRSGLTGCLQFISYNSGVAEITNKSNANLTFGTNDTERARITPAGAFLVGGTSDNPTGANVVGSSLRSNGEGQFSCNDSAAAYFNRKATDGTVISIYQDGTSEGSISVSGTTVSYNGAHLSRWSQLPSGAIREEILRGTVLSNIDEMCEWGEEDNEQLNRMKVSDVEGDPNVSGVFQSWDDDDNTYTDDFYCAMTGDFIIRIAEGVTVARGDLLMSAGDGTAKPQDDDIIRSKTVAKVTSNHVTCTYDDGSYCVPCVLMAC